LKDINDLEIPLPVIEQQIECVKKFEMIAGIINNRRKQLSIFDDLIKARFVEMFGDMLTNPMNWPEKKKRRLQASARETHLITPWFSGIRFSWRLAGNILMLRQNPFW
jgi:hypothetical protein